jgi:hypothetical protein
LLSVFDAMALLTDLLNLDLSGTTEKIIAEYIWYAPPAFTTASSSSGSSVTGHGRFSVVAAGSAWVHGDRFAERSLAALILLSMLNSGGLVAEAAGFVVAQIRSVFSSILFSLLRSV